MILHDVHSKRRKNVTPLSLSEHGIEKAIIERVNNKFKFSSERLEKLLLNRDPRVLSLRRRHAELLEELNQIAKELESEIEIRKEVARQYKTFLAKKVVLPHIQYVVGPGIFPDPKHWTDIVKCRYPETAKAICARAVQELQRDPTASINMVAGMIFDEVRKSPKGRHEYRKYCEKGKEEPTWENPSEHTIKNWIRWVFPPGHLTKEMRLNCRALPQRQINEFNRTVEEFFVLDPRFHTSGGKFRKSTIKKTLEPLVRLKKAIR